MKSLLISLKDFVDVISITDIIFLLLVLILIILIITMFYIFKLGQEYIYVEKDKGAEAGTAEINELADIAKNIEENGSKININLSDYEKEQEDNAIISYDELIKNADKFQIKYDDEEDFDDGLKVRKIELEPFNFKDETKGETPKVKVISYEKEEAFLEALKILQKNLI